MEPNDKGKITKAKILIVDDEEETVASLKSILYRFMECEIETTTAGYEAINLMRTEDFDLVILDLKMPTLTGFGVMREVEKVKKLPDILAVTAYDNSLVQDEAIKAGACDFLSKPWNLEILLEKIKNILQGKGKFKEIWKIL